MNALKEKLPVSHALRGPDALKRGSFNRHSFQFRRLRFQTLTIDGSAGSFADLHEVQQVFRALLCGKRLRKTEPQRSPVVINKAGG